MMAPPYNLFKLFRSTICPMNRTINRHEHHASGLLAGPENLHAVPTAVVRPRVVQPAAVARQVVVGQPDEAARLQPAAAAALQAVVAQRVAAAQLAAVAQRVALLAVGRRVRQRQANALLLVASAPQTATKARLTAANDPQPAASVAPAADATTKDNHG